MGAQRQSITTAKAAEAVSERIVFFILFVFLEMNGNNLEFVAKSCQQHSLLTYTEFGKTTQLLATGFEAEQ